MKTLSIVLGVIFTLLIINAELTAQNIDTINEVSWNQCVKNTDLHMSNSILTLMTFSQMNSFDVIYIKLRNSIIKQCVY